MYQPPAFREEDLATLHALIRAHPLGLLVTGGPDGLLADLVPFLVEPEAGPFGRLTAHVARANPQWRAVEAGAEALVVFQGPEGYISPSWYATKQETGKVVPTWNYAVVQARGAARAIHDSGWLRAQVGRLTDAHEAGRAHPWQVGDAPDAFVEAQLKGIVGIEIDIASLEGKWKVSQNRNEADRHGVADGLAAGNAADLAMAALVQAAGTRR